MAKVDFRLPKRASGIFAWSNWDAVPVAAAFAHLGFIIWLVADFLHRPLAVNLVGGLIYAVAISWNINGVSHNFLHTPYFRSNLLNRGFSLLESVTIGFSQTFYTWVHLRHHEGNSDRPGPDGTTRDWLSIYRYGRDGRPEGVWSYVCKGFFRDDPAAIKTALRERRPFDATWGQCEILAFAGFVVGLAVVNWKAVLFLIPFYYLGNCLSQLNGYYEHLNGDPDTPIAWGVSSYGPVYNLLWFNNGYHGEHHYRPATHWTRMRALKEAIRADQRAKGAHVIETMHALGFLAPANRRTSQTIGMRN